MTLCPECDLGIVTWSQFVEVWFCSNDDCDFTDTASKHYAMT